MCAAVYALQKTVGLHAMMSDLSITFSHLLEIAKHSRLEQVLSQSNIVN